MSKFKAEKRIKTPEEIESMPLEFKCSKDKSFNYDTTYEKGKTKFLIVGTYTPKDGRDVGYFYCSKDNPQYELIDLGFDDGKSLAKKKGFVNQIKNILISRGIALLDVVKTAISRDDSASDEDILFYSLDYDAFQKIDFSGVKIVANSGNAEFRLRQILIKIGNQEIAERINLIPQRPRGRRKKGESPLNKRILKQQWLNFFNSK